ncbi:RNA polymerase sigma factor [Pseudoduganella buxea]|uniref:RNA polymerase subunit sigma-24 n=1 Tax=Pseudoduganella buxea TaxID=1949069 RepID=A0A6I3SY25_9BURK|nr:RNA polymerase sigma factor [Pseudoduganella buxea]MTV54241.1 sigma-70 family RNA polymerase sigma factor [Pseudoduganella buxea]GGB82796.1 RNA polymerase subunit sigma-24 [Pseudoduganella buxea]
MTANAVHRTIEAVWRIESARIIAAVARMLRDVGLAEEMAQEALVSALETWPAAGLPANPAAWLMTAARNRALDWLRHRKLEQAREGELAFEIESQLQDAAPDLERDAHDRIGDDLLRLVFIACHPVLPTEGRVALTLRLLGGLTTDEIARAFLVPEATVAQRIVRAKRTLAEARVPFDVPVGHELVQRLASVLQVIYLVYNEGYAASAGADWMRPALCDEALRLGRILAGLVPGESEVHGLVALMEIQSSRARARTDAQGVPVLLLDQDRSRWDQLLIRRGLAALARAEQVAAERGKALGPYALQAAIAACHARARRAGDTPWTGIAALYDALAQLAPSPVVELNRAVAVAMAFGPAAGLEIVEDLLDEPVLRHYHLLPSVRGDFLFKLGRLAEARAELERAAGLTQNERERTLLLERAAACVARQVTTVGQGSCTAPSARVRT